MAHRAALSLMMLCMLCACNRPDAWDCIKTTGSASLVNRPLPPFRCVRLFHNLRVNLIQDTLECVEIRGGKNLLPSIGTQVVGDTLYLKNHNTCNFSRNLQDSIVVFLHYKKLQYLRYEGMGYIHLVNPLKDSIFIFESWNGSGGIQGEIDVKVASFAVHTGPADVLIKGKADVLYVYGAGQGVVKTRDLNAHDVYLTHKGSNDWEINTTRALYATLFSDGNVAYWGAPPVVMATVKGKGKLLPE